MHKINSILTTPNKRPNQTPCRPISPTACVLPEPCSCAMMGLSAAITPINVINNVENTELPNATAVKSFLLALPAIAVSTTPTPTAAICANIIGNANVINWRVSRLKSEIGY